MPRDTRLWKRNLLVLPRGLLTLYALAGLLYVAFYRTGGSCADTSRFLVGGLCYRAYPFLSAALLLGLILVVVGLIVFRGKPQELPGHLHSGTPTHFVMALLASLVVVPAIVWLVLYYVEASQGIAPFMTDAGGYPFQTKFLFLLVAVGAFFAFVPYLGLYLAHGRLRRAFLHEVELVAAQEPEPAFPGEAPEPLARNAVPPEEFVDESLWPDSRDDDTGQGTPGTAGAPMQTGGPPGGAAPDPRAATQARSSASPATSPGTSPTTSPAQQLDQTSARDSPAAARQAPAPGRGSPPPEPVTAARPRPRAGDASASGALPVSLPAKSPAVAPVVAVHAGCKAILPTGSECGATVGPGGRYCLRHACQGITAAGSPCRNPAAEGQTRCAAHSAA